MLDLANNSLLGSVPKCLNNIGALKILDTRDFVYFDNETLRYDLYVENLVLVPKGNELKYEKTLRYVRIIDLSSNNLFGSISAKISLLLELHFFNLSRNQLVGKILEKIGCMTELESIDFSRNHLFGKIPPSMSKLTFLCPLDLSYNNFSGRIPSSTQLQTCDALSYTSNPQLCGVPLPKNCTVDEEPSNRTPIWQN